MKRTLTSIAAASMVLGTVVPVAFASTTATQYAKWNLSLGTYSQTVPAVVAQDSGHATSFLPIYYLQQALKGQGYNVEWNGVTGTLNVTTPGTVTPDLSNISAGNGNLKIYLNGTLVQEGPFVVAKDPNTGNATSFVPIWYMEHALARVGFTETATFPNWSITPAANKLAITGTNSVGVGGKDSLGLTVNGSAVTGATWTVSGNGAAVLDQSGNFVASAAGTYTVTASYQGQTASATVVVYGQAAGVKVSAPSSLVANGMSMEKVTVTVVDANGNPVGNFSGSVNANITTNGAARLVGAATVDYGSGVTSLTGATAVAISNGTGTVQLVSGTAPNLSDTLSISNVAPTGGSALANVTASATVASVAQVATSVAVTAPKTIGVNQNNTQATVSAQVMDQTGNAMLTGVYPLTFSISGSSATFAGGSTTAQVLTAVGSSQPSVQLYSVQGSTTPTTITVTSSGLTAGTAVVNGAVVGNPAKLSLALATGSSASFAQGSTGAFTAVAQDSNGNTISGYAFTGTQYVKVTNQDGSAATNLTIGGFAPNATTGEYAIPAGGAFTIGTVTGAGTAAAGTYNVQVVDTNSSGALSASNVMTVTVTPATAYGVSVTAAHSYVAAASPSDTFTAQIVDQYGNAVADPNVSVSFTATRNGSLGTATLNGVTIDGVTPTAVVATTNSSGAATAVLNPQSYTNTWTVTGTVSGLTVTSNSAAAVVQPTVTAQVGVALKNQSVDSYAGTSNFLAGDLASLALSEKDQYGNAITSGENDVLKVTVSNASAFTNLPSASTSTVSVTTSGSSESFEGTLNDLNSFFNAAALKAGTAGSFNVSATDVSVSSATSGSATGYVIANSLASKIAVVVPSTGWTVSTTGESGPITLELVDAGGNPAPYGQTVYVSGAQIQGLLNGSGTTGVIGGSFRTSAGGVDETEIAIPAGTTSIQVWGNVTTAGTFFANTASAISSSNTVPSAPTSVTATGGNIGTKTVTATWGAVTGASSYNVSYSLNGGSTWTSPTSVNSATFTYTGSVAGQSVMFSVTAQNAAGTSAATVSNSASTPAALAATVGAPATLTATSVFTVKDQYGNAVASGTTVYAKMVDVIASGGTGTGGTATADAGTVTLTSTYKAVTTDASGNVTIAYTVGTSSAGSTDTVSVALDNTGTGVQSAAHTY